MPELFTPGFNHVNEGDTYLADEDVDIDTVSRDGKFSLLFHALAR